MRSCCSSASVHLPVVAEIAGPVARVRMRHGDVRIKGQVLVEPDPRSFDLSVQEARVAVDLAQ